MQKSTLSAAHHPTLVGLVGDGPCPQQSPGNSDSDEMVSREPRQMRGLNGAPRHTVGICDQLAFAGDFASGLTFLPRNCEGGGQGLQEGSSNWKHKVYGRRLRFLCALLDGRGIREES